MVTPRACHHDAWSAPHGYGVCMKRWVLALGAVALIAVVVNLTGRSMQAGATDGSLLLGDIQPCPVTTPDVFDGSEDPLISDVQENRAGWGVSHGEAEVWAALVEHRYGPNFGWLTPAEESKASLLNNNGDAAFHIAEAVGVPYVARIDWVERELVVDVETEAQKEAYLAELDRRVGTGVVSRLLANHIVVVASGTPWSTLEAEQASVSDRYDLLRSLGSHGLSPADALVPLIRVLFDSTELAENASTDVSSVFSGVDPAHVCVAALGEREPEPDQPEGEGWQVVGESFPDSQAPDDLMSIAATPERLREVWRLGGAAPDFDPLTHFVAVVTTGVSGSCPETNLTAVLPTSEGLGFEFTSYPQASACTGDWVAYSFAVLLERGYVGNGVRVFRDEHGVVATAILAEPGQPVREIEPPVPAPHAAPIIPISDRTLAPAGGTWWVDRGGGVYAVGGAQYLGGMGGIALDEPIVAIVPTPSGRGYWLFAEDGGVFAFGDAPFLGSIPGVLPPGTGLAKPIVDAAATPSGQGYWMAASDGGVFAFGDAEYFGSVPEVLGTTDLHRPIVGLGATPTGRGYAVAGRGGGLLTFGDAPIQLGPAVEWEIEGVSDVAVGVDGYRLEVGFTAIDIGDVSNVAHPSESMLGFCSPGSTRSSSEYGSTEWNRATPPGWVPQASMVEELRSRPELAGGIWLQVDNVFTDPIGGRQVWMRHDAQGLLNDTPGWYVDAYTRCVS
ncbi:MAG: hypothetical protein GY925_00060 [Actinomycetia bacterium]|nr:hypothetical protein [Actinomycetes bacterium]